MFAHFVVQPPKQNLKNVCTVEELERQLRQNQQPQNQNFFQVRTKKYILDN